MKSSEQCPCGNNKTYDECCAPFHQGLAQAETAEQLMRSRYAAFSKGQADYLLETLHPSKRNEREKLSIQHAVENCQWFRLEILDISAGAAEDSSGFVEFVAYYQEATPGVLRERSRFLKEDDVWFYMDGEPKKPAPLGRNEPCWCGSGKKTKKCHGVSI